MGGCGLAGREVVGVHLCMEYMHGVAVETALTTSAWCFGVCGYVGFLVP